MRQRAIGHVIRTQTDYLGHELPFAPLVNVSPVRVEYPGNFYNRQFEVVEYVLLRHAREYSRCVSNGNLNSHHYGNTVHMQVSKT